MATGHEDPRGREPMPAGLATLSSPNPENKLFVGGAPPGTDENTLQQVPGLHAKTSCHALPRSW